MATATPSTTVFSYSTTTTPTFGPCGGGGGGSGGGLLGSDGERFIWVMDPMTRKLKVPLSVIDPTQATATPGTVPSLCMLFLDGRCKHPACRQVHVTMPILQQLRKEAQHAPSCCSSHGDLRDNQALVCNFSHVCIVAGNGAGNSPVPSSHGNSPVPTHDAAPSTLPPPMYGSSPAKQQRHTHADPHDGPSPKGNATAASDARSPQPITPELSGALYPALPGNTSSPPPPATWSPQAAAQATATVAAAAGQTSDNTPPRKGGSPASAAREVLCTVPSSHVAMTVGLQRFLAQSGYLAPRSQGNSPIPTGGNSPVEASHEPILISSNTKNNSGGGIGGSGVADNRSPDIALATAPPTPNAGPKLHSPNLAAAHAAKVNSPEKDENGEATNNTLEIPLKMICRLHLSHKCRYLEDCNNVHLCRELEHRLPAPVGNHAALGPQHNHDALQALRPKGMTSMTMGNIVYSVKVIASGQITDTDMHQIVQSYKLQNPNVQLRIVDCRSPNSSAAAVASGGMLPTAMDTSFSTTASSSTSHYPAFSGGNSHHYQYQHQYQRQVQSSYFSQQPLHQQQPPQPPHLQVLFKAPGAPVSPQTTPSGPHGCNLGVGEEVAEGGGGDDNNGSTTVASQFAGVGTSPLLRVFPDPPAPPELLGGGDGGAAGSASLSHHHHHSSGGNNSSHALGSFMVSSDEPAASGGPSWAY